VGTPIEVLASIQELDTRIHRLERQIRDIPARQDQIAAKNDHLREVIVQTKEKLTHEQSAAKQLELDIESQKEKISKLREQQILLKTNKEFRAMQDEIKGHEAKISGIEDQEIALYDCVDVANTEVSSANKALDNAEEGSRQESAEMDRRRDEIQAELVTLTGKRGELAAEADPAWLMQYDRILSSKGDALVRVEHGTCSGCHMTIAPHLIHDARRGDSLTCCSFCGRLLY
jgi:predicted  nucleic acid-binding Zn-ribbon protein